ncbi:MAG: VCBS repeat-containing protein [Chloroflexota bacterium]
MERGRVIVTRHRSDLGDRTLAQRLVQRLALAICGVLAASLPIGTAIAPVALAGPTCVDGWQSMPADGVLAGGAPFGSAAVGGQPAWVVGRRSAVASIGRWDGSSWRNVAQPWTGDSGLNAVSAITPSVAWTVGYSRLYSPRVLSARWNGTSWQAVTVPQPYGRAAWLTDVVALSYKRALAVGLRLAGGRMYPVALFRGRTSWVNRSPTFGANTEGGLTASTRAPGGRLWAAGWRGDAAGAAPWIGYWDGSAWISTPAAPLDAGHAYMTDIAFQAPTDGWAVGYMEPVSGGYAPILQHWDGLAWQAEDLSWAAADESMMLTTVAVNSAGDVVVAGNRMSDLGPTAVMATRRAGVWQVTPAPGGPHLDSWANNATALTQGAFVAGQFGASGMALRACEPAPTGNGLIGSDGTSKPSAMYWDEDEPSSLTSGSGRAAAVAAVQLEGFHAEDVTAAAGLTLTSRTWSGEVADFNKDGWPDVFINRHGEAVPVLALGSMGGFTIATTNFQFTDRHGCAVADANGDDELDLFCSVGRNQGTGVGADEFLLNVGETGGTLAGEQFGVLDITGRGRAAAFVHLATDALPSLFVTNEPVRIDGLPSFNRFFRNTGTNFVPAPELGLDNSSGGQCAVAANLDADADDEILLCTLEPHGGLSAGARIYDFNGTRFVDRTAEWGIRPMADRDIEVADFNGDSLPDIAQLKTTRLRISLGLPTGGFEQAYQLDTSTAAGMAVGDVNEDQRPDIYVARQANRNRSHLMLVNVGDGTSFTNVAIPQASSGSADDALALDYDGNGLTDFLILNGLNFRGPVRLIAFFRTDE